ncbi:LysR family transcriptional regulator [Acidipila sp. EB88]|uniref:LysR family transcriptional regulator n=1 Tax=Acidipila sp. EB88 TaxID=2305226 RepID=UPI001315A45B|nr:LysR family transcriptional regulator [Acidipila sp. EB88]
MRYFKAVAEENGFARAAALLNVSQSAISEQMRDLEQELGLPLFDRREHRARLNAHGEVFLVEVKRTLAAAAEAVAAVRRSASGEVGTLKIGFFVGGTDALFPALIRRFRAQSPGVRVSLLEMGPVQQQEALLAGTIDIGFTRIVQSPASGELSWERLYVEPLVVALPKGHALAGSPVDISSLAAEPFVITHRETSPALFDKVIALCRAAGFSPKIAATAAVASSVLTLVAAGEGVAILPKNTLKLASSDVVAAPIASRDASIDLVIAWSTRREGPLHQAFLQLIRKTRKGSPRV